MTIKQISYKRHDSDKPSYIEFDQSGRMIVHMTRHEIFSNIARFETAERIKAEIEKRAASNGGFLTVETFFQYDNARAADDEQYYNERNQ